MATESPLKMMKNTFYFILKALFVLKIFKFLSLLFGHVEKRLIRKIRLISKFTTSKPGKEKFAIQILPNGNQTTKFGRLIEYNLRNIFLEKSFTKCSAETISRPFYKKKKLSISLDE